MRVAEKKKRGRLGKWVQQAITPRASGGRSIAKCNALQNV